MRKIKSKIKTMAAIAATFIVLAAGKVALAIGGSSDVPIGDDRAISSLDNPVAVANKIINNALMILGAVAVLLIIYAGFLYILPDEKGEGPKKAKSIITFTIVGIIIISIAGFIVKFAMKLF